MDRAWFSMSYIYSMTSLYTQWPMNSTASSHRILFLSVCSSNAFAGSAFMRAYTFRFGTFATKCLVYCSMLAETQWIDFSLYAIHQGHIVIVKTLSEETTIEFVNIVSAENRFNWTIQKPTSALISFNGVPLASESIMIYLFIFPTIVSCVLCSSS